MGKRAAPGGQRRVTVTLAASVVAWLVEEKKWMAASSLADVICSKLSWQATMATGKDEFGYPVDFDAMLARMQTPQARKGMKAAWDASPEELGAAALAGARKRRGK